MFLNGARAILPIIPGVIPFGMVMGAASSEAGLSFLQNFAMNIFVFAGASQLAAVDLMTQKSALIIVTLTVLIINLRFILYSAALADLVRDANPFVRFVTAYCITDQSYAVLIANQENLSSNREKILFFWGASACLILAWQSSVVLGFYFGNIAPRSFSLEFTVPLSFLCLVLPTLKNKIYVFVAVCSTTLSILFSFLPYNLGLIVSAFLAIFLGAVLTRKPSND